MENSEKIDIAVSRLKGVGLRGMLSFLNMKNGICKTEFAKMCHSIPAQSFYILKIMERAGLIETEKIGRKKIMRVNYPH